MSDSLDPKTAAERRARLERLLAEQRAKPESKALREAARRAHWPRPGDFRPVFHVGGSSS